jgi:hypothetical protein
VPEKLLAMTTTSNRVTRKADGTLMPDADVTQKDKPSAPEKAMQGDERSATTDQAKALGRHGADDSDSSVQVVHGPMRPLYPHYDNGVTAITAVEADSVKKEDDVAQVPLPEAAD